MDAALTQDSVNVRHELAGQLKLAAVTLAIANTITVHPSKMPRYQ
jgi:hypothetical protein